MAHSLLRHCNVNSSALTVCERVLGRNEFGRTSQLWLRLRRPTKRACAKQALADMMTAGRDQHDRNAIARNIIEVCRSSRQSLASTSHQGWRGTYFLRQLGPYLLYLILSLSFAHTRRVSTTRHHVLGCSTCAYSSVGNYTWFLLMPSITR
jgi:hypothetical protein